MKRQKIRKTMLLIALLLFPVTMFYLSPYLIIRSGFDHKICGCVVIFITLLLLSILGRRFFCGFLCPSGGLQECAFLVNDKQLKRSWKYNIKYIVWAIWLSVVILCYCLGSGVFHIDFLFMTTHGVSVTKLIHYAIYYTVVFSLFIPAIVGGKRFACHYFCWVAPFMIIGSKIGEKLHVPQLHIKGDKDKCINCGQCSKKCPMSIDVPAAIKDGKILDVECIQCGECIDCCPKKVLKYSMKSGK